MDTGDIKRTEQERDAYLSSVLASNNWIIEGVHHKWVSPCFQQAEVILFLDTDITKRRFRIIKRFIMQKLGVEKANYQPTLKILKDLYNYNTVFEHKSKPEIVEMLGPYHDKVIVIKSQDELTSLFK
ncbi:DNA topology modulation protein FlaR [Sporosarcina sp. Te-1]|uniref:DNA topology modulation protein FlaR n=1 Tax=Sporosarcina sp. Te-1 TaxID=2818390 RepID=UPI0035304946